MAILQSRLEEKFELSLKEKHGGFRRALQNFYIQLNYLMKKVNEYNEFLWTVFLGFRGAFDIQEYQSIFKSVGMPEFIKGIYLSYNMKKDSIPSSQTSRNNRQSENKQKLKTGKHYLSQALRTITKEDLHNTELRQRRNDYPKRDAE